MPRKYTKKADYWENRKNISAASIETPQTLRELPKLPNFSQTFDFAGAPEDDDLRHAFARRRDQDSESIGAGRNLYRADKPFKYGNIDRLPLPWNYDGDGVDIKDAISLVQKCYANIGIAKNSIDIMAETANTPFRLEGGTDKSKKFVNLWLEKIDISHIKEQFYQEAFRTGNIFFYKMSGNWSGRAFASKYSDNVSLASPSKLPLKYVLLNCGDIVRDTAVISEYQFSQKFNAYELNRMKSPKTEKEKELFKVLQKQVIDLDKTGIILEDKDIAFAFYGKQDYEPFALPYLWPVLDDINLKLEMKKRDQAILRIISNCILLITSGTKPEEGGVNQANIAALQRLFGQESIGKTLVADYTHKGEFIIPDLKKVIYPEKYTVVNEDIKEGLANILFGTDAKYGNLVVKVRIFLQKMAKARLAFEKMMQREINIACDYMGLVSPPTIKTDSESLEDPAVIQKTALRLLELGVLTPEDAIPLLKNREFPSPESLSGKQSTYVKEREEGKWIPVIGQPMYDNGIGQGASKDTPKAAGRPKEKGMASSVNDWAETIKDRSNLEKNILSAAASKFQIDDQAKEVFSELSMRIFRSESRDNWESMAKKVIENPESGDKLIAKPEIMELAIANNISIDDAALWYWAQESFKINSQTSEESVVEVKE